MFTCWPVLQAHHASRLTQGPPRWAWGVLTCHSIFPSQKTLQHRLAFMLNLLWFFPKNLVTLPQHRDHPRIQGEGPRGKTSRTFCSRQDLCSQRADAGGLPSEQVPPSQGCSQSHSSGPGPGSALDQRRCQLSGRRPFLSPQPSDLPQMGTPHSVF